MTDPRRSPTTSVNRRLFLGQAAGVSAVAAAFPTVVPARALGRDGNTAPSERIVLGGIGIGSRGTYVLNWMLKNNKDVQFVAICDARKERRLAVKAIADKHHGNADCKMYPQMDEFLAERPDIQAILLATGDRWHALGAIKIMRAGKDVYSEKPSCMTIAEGKAVVETAKKTGKIYQTGVQRLSEPLFVKAIELAKAGKLGKVHTVRAHIAPWDDALMRHDWLTAEPEPTKDEVDFDAWLGPCPPRPYNSAYIKGAWRGHYDFHTSCIGEWGAHTFAQGQAGIDALDTSPVKYTYVDNISGDGMVTEFASGVKLVLQREGWKGSCGMTFEGTEGTASCADGYKETEVSSPALIEEGNRLVAEYAEKTGRALDHVRNFFDCVKSRQQTVANAEVMYHSMATVHAANICMWLKQDLTFDPAKGEFPGNAGANRFVSRPMRAPYTV
jgi:predicted dehydrogenase